MYQIRVQYPDRPDVINQYADIDSALTAYRTLRAELQGICMHRLDDGRISLNIQLKWERIG